MGFARAKEKDRLLYHKPQKGECLWNGKTCKTCRHRQVLPIYNIGEDIPKAYEPRCELIGLGNSRRYAIRDDHTC